MNDTIDYEKIGKKIRRKREQLAISQSELAEKIDVSPQAISNIERGKNENGGSVRHFVNIAIALDVSLDDLFEIEERKKVSSITTQTFLDTIKFFVKLINPTFCNRRYAESPASLEISDFGVNYFLQEFYERIELFSKISTSNKDLIEKTKSSILDDLDQQIEKEMIINDHSLMLKPESCTHFKYDSNEGKIVIEKDETT